MSENTGIHALPVQNEGTRIQSVRYLEPAPRLLNAHEAFIVAYDRLNGLSRIARAPAVLVAAVDARAHVVAAVIVEAGQSLVIGRHTHCDIRLEKDTIALRHLVAHASAGAPEAAPATRLWELNTGQPFLTEDGKPNAAVLAQGPLYAAVDQYALLFVPTQGPSGPPWPTSAEEAWKALPPREFIDRRTPRQPPHAPGFPVRRPDGQAYETNISSVRQLHDRTSISRVSRLWLLGDEDPGDAFGELVLQHDREVAKHRHLRSRGWSKACCWGSTSGAASRSRISMGSLACTCSWSRRETRCWPSTPPAPTAPGADPRKSVRAPYGIRTLWCSRTP